MWYGLLNAKWFFVIFVWLVPSWAHATDHHKTLLLHLSQMHGLPAVAKIKNLVPDTEAALVAIVADPNVVKLARMKAIALLGAHQTPTALNHLQALALDEQQLLRLRLAATHSLLTSFAHHPQTLPTLAQLLQQNQAGLRQYAVLGLARINSLEAQNLLRQQQRIERHVAVRTALRKALPLHGPLADEGILHVEKASQPGSITP